VSDIRPRSVGARPSKKIRNSQNGSSVEYGPSDPYGGCSVPATTLPRNGEMNAMKAQAPANLKCFASV
jgi:hypothetical protein